MGMAYRYRSRRSVKRLSRKSKNKFILTLIIIAVLIYATLFWILPNFIGGIGFVKNTIKPPNTNTDNPSKESAIAPPVLNIPFEATNTAEIDIKGFGTPNSKVKLYVDDDPKQTVDVGEDGSFNFTNISLALGTNNIYAKTVDEKGTESLPSKTLKIIYDNEKPTLNISEPEDGKKIQGGDKKVKISGNTEPGVKVYINDSQVVVDKDGNFSTDQQINEGDNSITIKAIDAASNTTEEQRKVNYTP